MSTSERGPGGSAAGQDGIGEAALLGAGGTARIDRQVYSLAKRDPKSALSRLRDTVGAWDDDALERLVEGRSEAVCALVEIAHRGEDFGEAAMLLLRLEANGDTTGPGNAAGAFSWLFVNAPPHAVQAGADDRIALLAEMLGGPDERQRRLALRACDMALETVRIMRWDCEAGHPVAEFVRDPIGKEYDGYRKALQMLLEMVGGMGRDERQEAAKMIRKRAVEMSRLEGMSVQAAGAIRLLHEKQLADRADLVQAAEMALGGYGDRMGGEALAAWRSLVADMGGPV